MDFQREGNRIFALDAGQNLLAEITFPMEEDGVLNINHTYVSDSLRGQGVASQLMQEAVRFAQDNGLKIRPTCSYAISWLEKHDQYRHLMRNSFSCINSNTCL